jgi:UDP-MurNAc hydroxylase
MRATSLGQAGILIETADGSIVCDPWFVPAFFASWFVFPRNDQLGDELHEKIRSADYLYVSHLHGDHFDETWLADERNVRRDIAVLVPGYPSRELDGRLRALGFDNLIRTTDGEELRLGGDGSQLTIAIHVETSITDGPGGDSALVVSDGTSRLVNQNDCRTTDLAALAAHGTADLHWLQYSGAIWYPMVYEMDDAAMRHLVDAKVESQLTRAMRYVESIDARAVVPSAGPPCFLDPALFHLNLITGEEPSIFVDQRTFLARLVASGHTGVLAIPGTTIEVTAGEITVTHPIPDDDVNGIFEHKGEYLAGYQADWSRWLAEMHERWAAQPETDLVPTLREWWGPLLAACPTVREGIGAACLLRTGDVEILIDFPAGEVRAFAGEPYGFRFEIERTLVEKVVAERAVDWSNSLFLSCRFRAWRAGEFNEYVYNFFKSLSPGRMRRTEAEALRKLHPPTETEPDIELDGWVMQRRCPHRNADLSVFGEIHGCELVCTLHGWRFDLETGKCLTSVGHELRVRRRDTEPGR